MFGFSFAYNGVNPALIDSGASFDPDAQSFFTATGITDTTQKNAVNKLVLDLKSYGIWTKMKAIYPMVGGTATTHKFNLKDPQDTNGAFRLTFTGGWTHSSTGALPNGTNAFANTFLNTATNLSINNGHLSYYSRTDQTAGVIAEIGSLKSLPDSFSDIQLKSSSGAVVRINNTTAFNSAANTNSTGFYIGSRTASNVIKMYKNGSVLVNGTASSNATSTINFYIGAQNNNGTAQSYSQKECAFASLGDGLIDAEASNFYISVQTFNTTLGRQVP